MCEKLQIIYDILLFSDYKYVQEEEIHILSNFKNKTTTIGCLIQLMRLNLVEYQNKKLLDGMQTKFWRVINN